MLRFQRACLSEVLFVFLSVLGVVTSVVFAATTLRLFYRGEGVGADLMLDLMPSLLPVSLSYSLPFSWLASVALVLGRMAADKEIVALGSAGLHLRALAVPLLTMGLVVSAAAVAFNLTSVPDAERALRAGVRRYLGVFLASLKDVDRTVTLENGRFSFGRYADGAFHDVELDRRGSRGSLELKILARRMTIRPPPEGGEQETLEFVIEDAYVLTRAETGEPTVEHRGGSSPLRMGRVERVGASILFNEFFGTQRFVERPKDMPLPDLLYAVRRGGVWRGSPARVLTSLHGRLADGAAPFVLGLFAIGMALLLPIGNRRVLHFLLCFVPPVVIYFPLVVAGPAIGRSGALPPWLIMWLPALLVGSAGAVLLALSFRR